MTITVFGAILIPVAIIISIVSPFYLLPLLIISSVFQGGSVFNGKIGEFEFGLPPFYFVALCVAFRYLLSIIGDGGVKLSTNPPVRRVINVLLWFWAWCVVSSFVLPRFFAGVEVYDPREGIDQQYFSQTPLSWSMSNLSQAVFLTLEVIAILYAIRIIKTSVQNGRLAKALLWSSVAVAITGLLELFSAALGWAFPYEILNSNPVYNQGFDQVVGAFQRVNTTFTEPSYAGAFLAAIGAGILAEYFVTKQRWFYLLILLLLVAVLFATTSTTGYLAFAVSAILLLTFYNPTPDAKRGWKKYSAALSIIAILGTLGAILLINSPDLYEAALQVTVDKMEDLSFLHRVASDAVALGITQRTYGLGVGLGSNRPSSLVTSMLSNVGLPGTLFFGFMLYYLYKGYRLVIHRARSHFVGWCLAGVLIAQSIAIPDLTFSVLWSILLVAISQLNVLSAGQEPSFGD